MRWGSLSTGSEGRLPLRPTPIFRPPNDDNPEWTAENFRRAVKVPKGRKLSDAPALLKRGQPKISNPKVAIKLRLDSDVLEAYRETGDGWQTRIISEDLQKARQLKKAG
jgi:uncharacterized protein (DUF4415 family)